MTMANQLIPPEDVQRILSYLELPPSDHLPSSPFTFLAEYLPLLPPPLLEPFSAIIPPRNRSSIPTIKSRRLLYATSTPPPTSLSAEEGRLRWPLLWERLGGDPGVYLRPSHIVNEEDDWVREGFMKDIEGSQHVKKLGGFLRGLEEEREMEGVRAAKRMERSLDDVGEEFDSESDDEGQAPGEAAGIVRPVVADDQGEVRSLFEKRLMELFLDGLDTIPYDPIDFSDPPEGDPIARRDAEDRYFDDEEPSPSETKVASTVRSYGVRVDGIAQNGDGEYDY